MFVPQRQTKTPMRGRSPRTLISERFFGLGQVLRASERISPAAAEAALESTTAWGMSFGPWNAPQTKIPGRDVATGCEGVGIAELSRRQSIPSRRADQGPGFGRNLHAYREHDHVEDFGF
jgi:hypothetical protein